jgi:hypothetical protein
VDNAKANLEALQRALDQAAPEEPAAPEQAAPVAMKPRMFYSFSTSSRWRSGSRDVLYISVVEVPRKAWKAWMHYSGRPERRHRNGLILLHSR